VIVHVKVIMTQYIGVMEDMEEDGHLQADALTSLEYTSFEGVTMKEVTNSVNENDNESADNIRGLTQDTLLHSESISYDVLCAMAGTNNLGSIEEECLKLPRTTMFLENLPPNYISIKVFHCLLRGRRNLGRPSFLKGRLL
jgi:hypothetical protein